MLTLSIQQKRLFLHRYYFSLSSTHPEYALSRHVSLSAALKILDERRIHDFPFDDKLDTINHVLPAAIILLLDALYPLSEKQKADQTEILLERCVDIEGLLDPLRGMTYRNSTREIVRSLRAVDDLLKATITRARSQSDRTRVEDSESSFQPAESSFCEVLDDLDFSM